jgi:hypothetical protein
MSNTTHTIRHTFDAAAFARHASIREAWALMVAEADPSPVPPPTMGRYGPLRLKPEVTITGEGGDAAASVVTPAGLRLVCNAPDWFRIVRAFGGVEMPAIYAARNARGTGYPTLMLPPCPSAPDGLPVPLARLLAPLVFGPGALRENHVRVRDGNPWNLRRANLVLRNRREAAAEAGA